MIDTLLSLEKETVVTLMIIVDVLAGGLIIHLIRKHYKNKQAQ